MDKEIALRREFTPETSNDKLYSIGQINLAKVEFQAIHGVEDSFKFVSEEDGVKIEVNGYRGLIKLTSEEDGEIVLNLFESLDSLYEDAQEELKEMKAPNRPSAWKTQGPDKANLKVVKGSSKDTLYASAPSSGYTKKYTKNTNDWYSGYTKGYYNNVQNARKSWGNAKSNAGNIPVALLSSTVGSFVTNGDLKISVATLKAALIAGGAGATIASGAAAISYGVAYLAHLELVRTNYNSL